MKDSHKRHSEVTDNLAEPVHNLKDISVKAWSQKLLVALLCVASFYGGWKSYESNMANQCFANGGKIVEGERTMLCEVS